MKIIPQWIFRDLDEEVPRLLKEGIRTIETQGESCGFFLRKTPEELKDTHKHLKENGVSIYAIHAPFKKPHILSSPDEKQRRNAVETYKDLLRKACLLETKVVVIHSGIGVENKEETRKRWSLFKKSIMELRSTAIRGNITLAVENGSECEHYRQIFNLLKSINSQWLKACFDVGHAHIAGASGMWQGLRLLGGYLGHIHMHDNDGIRDYHLQPPYGIIHWRKFGEVLKEINYTKAITIEAYPWAGRSYKWQLEEVAVFFKEIEKGMWMFEKRTWMY